MDFKCDELILGKKDADSRALTAVGYDPGWIPLPSACGWTTKIMYLTEQSWRISRKRPSPRLIPLIEILLEADKGAAHHIG